MKKIIVFFIFLMLTISSYNKSEIKQDKIVEETSSQSNVINVTLLYNDRKETKELNDYIIGVVACEMPASFDIEALKALSIAARTFALYKLDTNKNYTFKTTVQDQCYISKNQMKKNWGTNYEKNYNKIVKAVSETQNEYMTYNDKIIIPFYFSMSNGYTENSENVFVQKLDYLRSVPSTFEEKYNYKETTKKLKIKDFLSKLDINDTVIKSLSIKRSDTGRINTITINNKKLKGTTFRSKLSLRSTDVEINYDTEYVYLKTKGNGHGVGLSQYGAEEMALLGYKYDEILKYYYSGIKIMNNL